MNTVKNHITARVRTGAVTAAAIALAVGLTGCGGEDTSNAAEPTGAASASESTTAAPLTVEDPWVKAADSGMSAMFGTLHNDSDEEITVVGASTDAAAMVELHEMAASGGGETTMQEKKGGFPIPAGDSYELAPGGDHVMLMELTGPLQPGAQVTVTLELSDGGTVEVTAPVKEFAGADEEYADGAEHQDEHGNDHGDHG